MHNYIGLDAHSKTCTFVVVDKKGRETANARIKTGESEVLRFVRSVKGKKSLTFEECHLSKWLYTILKPEVDELIVCNPVFINRRKGPKDDYPDTLHLAQQLRGNFLTQVFHEDNFFSRLRNVVSAYEDLNTELIQLKNRYKALFRLQAHQSEGSSLYKSPEWIKDLSSEENQFIATGLFEKLQLLRQQKISYRKRFQRYEKEFPLIEALSSIPGIGEVRACIIAAIVVNAQRFENKFKFWAYCMLVKYNLKSDDRSYGKKKVGGNRALKNVFMGAAHTVITEQLGLKSYYDQLKQNGIDHKAAKKNLARKIAAISLAVMRKGTHYQDDYEVKNAGKA